MPGFLYQTDDEGKKARQWRDRERVCVDERQSVGGRVG
jgi:hypothetical protein